MRAPQDRHSVEARADAQPLEELLGRAPRARDEAVEQGEGAGAGRGEVVEHGHHAGHPGGAGLGGHEGRVDGLGRERQPAVAVRQQGGVVAVAAEDGRHEGQLPLGAQARVLADRACESR